MTSDTTTWWLESATAGITPDEAQRLQARFGTRSLKLEQVVRIDGSPSRLTGTATILNVLCDVEVLFKQDGQVQTFSALCARPKAGSPAWHLGTSFPDLGAAAEPIDAEGDDAAMPEPEAGFLLQQLTLTQPILVYTVAHAAAAAADLAAASLWAAWVGAETVAFDHHDGYSLFGRIEALDLGQDGPLSALRRLVGADGDYHLAPVQLSIDWRPFPYLKLRQPIGGKVMLGPLSLGNAAVAFEALLVPGLGPARVLVSGTATVDPYELELTADVPLGRGELVVTGVLAAGSASLTAGAGLEGLPAPAAGERLEVELDIDLAAPRLDRIRVLMQRDHWTLSGLSPDVLTLQQPGFQITVDDPLGRKIFRASAWAELVLQLKDKTFAFAFAGSYPAGPITGALVATPEHPLALQDLAQALGMASGIVPNVLIEELRLSYGLGGDGWDFEAAVGQAWPAGEAAGLPGLQQVRFSLHGPSPVSAHLAAQFHLGDALRFNVSASHGDTGWDLLGSTSSGDRIEVGHLLSALTTHYGPSVHLPQAFSSLAFEDLSMAWHGAKGLTTFAGRMTLSIEEQPVRVDLCVEVRNLGAAHSVDVSGQLIVGGHAFHFKGQSATGEAAEGSLQKHLALCATYQHDPASTQGPPDVQDLVAALSPALAAVVPSIKVPAAVLAYLSDDEGGVKRTRWLFGARFDTDLSLHLDDPVLGVLLGDHLNLSVRDTQLVLSSAPFSQQDLEQLGPTGDVHLPTALGRGIVSTTLVLGDVEYPLALPFGKASAIDSGEPVAATPQPVTSPATTPVAPAAIGETDDKAATTAPAGTPADAATDADTDTQWVQVNRQLGPLHVARAGVAYRDGKLSIALGLSVTASSLTLSLQGLRIETPLNAFKPRFDLAGLGLGYSAGAVEISGGLIKTGSGATARFDGEALIKAASFNLSALGSYAHTLQGQASLFVFALLDKELGGPAFFHVTGLAAGFGYNRRLKLPSLDEVHSFPLVALAMADADKATDSRDRAAAALASLAPAIEVAQDENWLAIGVRFTSFGVVKSFALLAVSFGTELEINLIGESVLTMPTDPVPGQPLVAYARLTERVTYIPDRGTLLAAAKLSPDSYILSADCHLTGGFALAKWFKGDHEGDFVVSLGGYHPHFVKPAHYPDVAPVGFNWQVGHLSINGGMYFALTPTAVMAGGHLDAVWDSGGIRAWFLVDADFLMSWQPFHYEASVSVSIGASFTVDLWITSFTMTIHVGVALQLWGPAFGGTASIDLSVISFSVDFGEHRPGKAAIAWSEFRKSFLPPLAAPAALPPVERPLPFACTGTPIMAPAYCMARAAKGLDQDLGEQWVVSGTSFELVTNTAIPANAATMYYAGSKRTVDLLETYVSRVGADGQGELRGAKAVAAVEVGPSNVAAENFKSEHVVAVTLLNGLGQPMLEFDFLASVVVQACWANVPRALWNVDVAMNTDAAALDQMNQHARDGTATLAHALVGFHFTPKVACQHSANIDVTTLLFEDNKALQRVFWSHPVVLPSVDATAGKATSGEDTLMSVLHDRRSTRQAVLAALGDRPELGEDERLTALPLNLVATMRHEPARCALGAMS